MKTELTTGEWRRNCMKFSLSVCASAMLMVPLSAAAEISGMYYCNGAVFADVAKTRVIGYSPSSKLTVKTPLLYLFSCL